MAEDKMHRVGELIVPCPRCEAQITIPIHAGLVRDDEEPGKVYVRTSSEVDQYWLHFFMHAEGMI